MRPSWPLNRSFVKPILAGAWSASRRVPADMRRPGWPTSTRWPSRPVGWWLGGPSGPLRHAVRPR
eukprot:7224590-Alexandrium_andersonii.AAC.1